MIVCVANQKGGVGKTTTAVNLAYGAALQGVKTLIIDLDAQGNVADSLGIDEGPDLYEWMFNGVSGKKVIEACQWKERPRIMDVIRSDKTTTMLKMALSGIDFREMILVKRLEEFEHHDLIILDCPPSIDVLQVAALVAAHWLIIPTRLDQFAIKGVAAVMQSLAHVRHGTKSCCQLAGIIPTFFERRTNESHNQLVNLVEAFGKYIWPIIPSDVNCRMCNRIGKTLWEIEHKKPAALIGIKNSDGDIFGGYKQVLKKMMEL